MKRYLITHENFSGELELAFDLDSVLFATERRAELTPQQARWIYSNLPLQVAQLREWAKDKAFKIVEVPADLSFEAFWKAWPGEAVAKDRAKQIWDRKSERFRTEVLWSLSAYRRYIQRNSDWYKPQWPDAYIGRKEGYKNDWDTMGNNPLKQRKRDTL